MPGFLALKVFYVFGLRTRRTDLEWTLWSLLAAAVIDAAVGAVIFVAPAIVAVPRLVLALIIAIAAGFSLAGGWYLIGRVWPVARQRASRMAWDAILPHPQYVQIWMTDGNAIFNRFHVT